MSATDQDPDIASDGDCCSSISELSPSAKLVYKVLEYEGVMTQEEIATESRLCARTVRYALRKLEESALVTSRVSLEDARKSKYWIS
ncbi:MarR family transcriptional regulator [Natrarchaeobius halalkaliphilus]|uniref:MarR family transcriptional regulator n=1 Tax=Natrarchaeobius halalkaliphilus TaxID=1679091 RepID=A0A3N6LS04_9EURY|nr:MarR family transcriptional regulator [Natrarchaeobius halalkaliphilus]RQG91267.1 MarR family transcriptional regulator [Natrarchaeobius halalkaliphilus]